MWFAMLQGRWDKHISGGRATCNQISTAEWRTKNDLALKEHFLLFSVLQTAVQIHIFVEIWIFFSELFHSDMLKLILFILFILFFRIVLS